MGTFLSCDYNQRLKSDYSLENRRCEPCKRVAPFSFGFAEEVCSLCASYYEVNAQADPIQQYVYGEACWDWDPDGGSTGPDPVDPVDPTPNPTPTDPTDPVDPTEPTDFTDPTSKPGPSDGSGDKVTENGGEAEEEEEPLSVMFWVFLAGMVAACLVGGYCAY